MKTAGVIAEYNPLHNGHAWQLQQIQAALGPDVAIVVVMSGSFTQRGEPAVLDKWTRTRMALACGASLVLELPLAYATASAERFAAGGVQLLAATGITRTLVFSSEHGRLAELDELAAILAEEPPLYRTYLKQQLDTGMSFAAARQQALALYLGDPARAALLEHSNNILAVEYLKAIHRLPEKDSWTPVTFQRQGPGYLDPDRSSPLASATAIRQVLAETRHDQAALLLQLAHAMPPASLGILLEAVALGQGPVRYEDLAVPVLTALRTHDAAELTAFAGMGEGLAQRLVAAAARPEPAGDAVSGRLDRLVTAAMSRRLPRTRVQRALLAMLLHLGRDELAAMDAAGGPAYIRVLGFDRRGRYLLKLMRRTAHLPVISRGSDFLEYGERPALRRQAQLDLAGTDLWSLLSGQQAGADFDRSVVIR